MNYKDIITIESGKRGGMPCIRGMRITVYDVLSYLAAGMTEQEIFKDFPYLAKEDIIACLRAMNIANALLSNYKYPNVKDGDIVPQYESVKEVRACLNELACTCDDPKVLDQMRKILFSSVSPEAIVDLRNAVRKELRFSAGVIDTDREKAFVGKVVCEEPKPT